MSDKLILKKQEVNKRRRATVVVPPDTYVKMFNLSVETGMPVEKLVGELLEYALERVEIQ